MPTPRNSEQRYTIIKDYLSFSGFSASDKVLQPATVSFFAETEKPTLFSSFNVDQDAKILWCYGGEILMLWCFKNSHDLDWWLGNVSNDKKMCGIFRIFKHVFLCNIIILDIGIDVRLRSLCSPFRTIKGWWHFFMANAKPHHPCLGLTDEDPNHWSLHGDLSWDLAPVSLLSQR